MPWYWNVALWMPRGRLESDRVKLVFLHQFVELFWEVLKMQNMIAICCFHVGRPNVINLKSMMTIKHPRIQSQLGKSFIGVLLKQRCRIVSANRNIGWQRHFWFPVKIVPMILADESHQRIPNDTKSITRCILGNQKRICTWWRVPRAALVFSRRKKSVRFIETKETTRPIEVVTWVRDWTWATFARTKVFAHQRFISHTPFQACMLEADILNGLSSCLRNVYKFQASVSVRRIDDVGIFLHVNILWNNEPGKNRHPCCKGPPHASHNKYARTENHDHVHSKLSREHETHHKDAWLDLQPGFGCNYWPREHETQNKDVWLDLQPRSWSQLLKHKSCRPWSIKLMISRQSVLVNCWPASARMLQDSNPSKWWRQPGNVLILRETIIESFFGPYVSCSTIPFHKNDAYQKRFIKNKQNMIYTYYIYGIILWL